MIRDFHISDLTTINYNDIVDLNMVNTFRKSVADYNSYTLDVDGYIKCLIFFKEYAKDCYEGMFICAKEMDAQDGKTIKDFMYEKVKEKNMKRIQTLSIDNDLINRWHNFLELECEGTLRKFVNGNDYKIWSRVWE